MMNWQPVLIGSKIRLRPLLISDFDELFAAASDPFIWEQHPDRERYRLEKFQVYFDSAIESRGALVVIDQATKEIIGSSRFLNHSQKSSSIEIGYTFLTRNYWGSSINREMKALMFDYAFRSVENVYFVVGRNNFRSQKAMAKLGAVQVFDPKVTPHIWNPESSIGFHIAKRNWRGELPTVEQAALEPARLRLEPVTEDHAQELWELFQDPELHQFVSFEAPTLERQRERCLRWSKRRSPDGSEIWLNWAARTKSTAKIVGHFQVGLKCDGVATVGYVVARSHQNQGLATKALQLIFEYMASQFDIRELVASTDTRNEASQKLCRKLGMIQVQLIKNADVIQGVPSDDFIFSKRLR